MYRGSLIVAKHRAVNRDRERVLRSRVEWIIAITDCVACAVSILDVTARIGNHLRWKKEEGSQKKYVEKKEYETLCI